MVPTPHPDPANLSVACAVITISDTRTFETDRSGQMLQHLLETAGHLIAVYEIVKDEPSQIQAQLQQWGQDPNLEALILNGGTGIAPRDTTYDVIASLLDKTLPGFGELFRFLSYQEIGSRAMATRAVAGTYGNKLVFALPGSTHAVQLATEKLLLPELVHLTRQLQQQS